jgi:hypothetical protein
MTVYFHDTEELCEYENVVQSYLSGDVQHYRKASVLDSKNGQVLLTGKIKQLITQLENV